MFDAQCRAFLAANASQTNGSRSGSGGINKLSRILISRMYESCVQIAFQMASDVPVYRVKKLYDYCPPPSPYFLFINETENSEENLILMRRRFLTTRFPGKCLQGLIRLQQYKVLYLAYCTPLFDLAYL
jgi:hypothetical protein